MVWDVSKWDEVATSRFEKKYTSGALAKIFAKPYITTFLRNFHPAPRACATFLHMARSRNWSIEDTLEVLIRHSTFHQSYAEIARAMSRLSYQQVRNFLLENQLQENPPAEWQQKMQAEITDRIRGEIAQNIVDSVSTGQAPVKPPRRRVFVVLPPELRISYNEEVEGCIREVKKAAAQFGLSARRFLHDCITHPDSVG